MKMEVRKMGFASFGGDLMVRSKLPEVRLALKRTNR